MSTIPEFLLNPDEVYKKDKLEQIYNQLIEEEAQIILEKSPHMPEEEIEARAITNAALAVMKWPVLSDSLMLYIILEMEKSQAWQHMKEQKSKLYDSFQSWLETLCETDKTIYGNKSAFADWTWIIGKTLPDGRRIGGIIRILERLGYPLSAAIEIVKSSGKLRKAIPSMRHAEREYFDDPERAYAEIVKILENNVLGKRLSPEGKMETFEPMPIKYEKSNGGIPATHTEFYATNSKGGGIVTIHVDSEQERRMVEKTIKPVIAEPEQAFSNRDFMAGDLGRQIKDSIKIGGGKYILYRNPLTQDDIEDMIAIDDFQFAIAIDMSKAVNSQYSLYSIIRDKLREIAPGYSETFQFVCIHSYIGNELQIRVKIPVPVTV